MSEADIRSKISAKEDEITKVEEAASKKETEAENQIKGEYDPKIDETSKKLAEEQKLLDEAIQNFNQWKAKMEEKKATVKNLGKELKTLKSTKDKALKTKLKEIQKEKSTNIKAIQKEIKALQKELAALQKASQT
ncbi:MAG: hypothetical protein ACTSYC_01125 [Promethearchaeota archaeon]